MFQTAFDQKKAKEKGAIIPCKGVIPEYDNAISDIADTKDRLQEYLDKQKKRLGCRVSISIPANLSALSGIF